MASRLGPGFCLPLLALAAVPTQAIVASEFMTADAARKAAFPLADRYTSVTLATSTEQLRRVAALAGRQPGHGRLQIWQAWRGEESLGHVFIDEVLGRLELITYSVAIDANGRLGQLEILGYREGHGGEVRSAGWRRQFAGRSSLGQLRPAIDISNISGATLSCEHLTQGVRRLYALWQVMLAGKDN